MTPRPAPPEPSGWVNRRRFLTISGSVAGAMMFAARNGTAFAAGADGTAAGGAVGYPDKGISAGDVAALYQRGNPSSYTGSELRYIGMPVGGGACGQVYLGGDGKLWYWDVDNAPAPPWANCNGPAYADPHIPFSPFGNGFVLRTATPLDQPTAPSTTNPPSTTTPPSTTNPPATATTTATPPSTTTTPPDTSTSQAPPPTAVETNSSARAVDSTGFAHVSFTGQYPLGQVDYGDPSCPLTVHLDAFAPFVPGEVEDSTLPVTVLAYTLTNGSPAPVIAELTGWAENPVAMRARGSQPITLSSKAIAGQQNYRGVQFTAANAPVSSSRPDIVFETWQQSDYSGWTVTGTAFGAGPVLVSQVPAYMLRFGNLNAQGPRFVTSHNFIAANNDPTLADSYVGSLTSGTFTVSRRYVAAWVGGGNNPGQTCLNVVVAGNVVGSVTADNTEPMHLRYVDLVRYQGQAAHIEVVDSATGGWGHINLSTISFTDVPASSAPVGTLPDGGTVAIAVLGNDIQVTVRPSIADWSSPTAIATSGPGPVGIDGGLGTITGAVTARLVLAPGQSHTVRFVLSWFFPNPDRVALGFLTDIANLSRHYANRFDSAQAVVQYLAAQLPRLEAATREWVRTWYTDSTLPHWLLERTLHTSGSLATNVAIRLSNGRFYAWEGVDCAPGTCEHVWSYAHGIARLFPALERDTRQRVDLGIGFHPDTGEIGNRAEADMTWATDGQCGTILRFYREHQMSPDNTFLTTNWPRIKQAMGWVIS
ncbi:MAG TPA: GH116 family glycosyl-hydrolase, partial [Pseudonocardiaceae bacterium]